MILLDTSGLLCLQYEQESRHQQAVTAYRMATAWITHSFIIDEYMSLATARRYSRTKAINFINSLLNTPKIEIVWVDEFLVRAAVTLLQNRPDKTYSLCDTVSFVLMQQRGIREALTTDKHFTQEGFTAILRQTN
ncbi:type II toxin-antitoxin system VapC family toxin [Limnothrix sp. FACHB-708]|uniref:type II toxin-antitoxin system VapC family toxin n=1 Tax=unclassified Limnothrix TaxID=2632864 RepID=UPI001681EBC2|nr:MULTISPECIES: PIN domain-containing protein [unclassified Limnothrix]MBD2554533.1 type II toxin-antitoxin system VapC family toxin [Limnothrix sp. FACHB-708]MBD2591559.1 type II toxin-antitoxin system VapC family toxin [Limnothrix sp. FACHB-406]